MLTGLLQVLVVVSALRARCFLRFFPLNFYMLCASVATVARYSVFRHYGLTSPQYSSFYFYSDLLLTICLYFTLMWLFHEVFREMGAGIYVQVGAIAVLGLTAVISYLIVRQASGEAAQSLDAARSKYAYAVELSRNLYFVGTALTYLLWGAMLKLHKTQTRLIHIVLSLGIYFSAFTATYALYHFYHTNYWLSNALNWTAGLWLPAAWAYAFLRFPAEASLSPAQLAAGH
jgi:hypothetical protein